MLEFWSAAASQPLARNAVLAALLLSVACGTVGTYVVVRRITYIAAGVAHCVLGGMGAARYLQTVLGWEFFHPMYGALIAALTAAGVIGWVSVNSREREDSAISAVWSLGMALGVIFIYLTPGYTSDLMGYLFGNSLLVTSGHLYFILAMDVVVLGMVLYWFDEFEAVCFDEEYARTRNISVSRIYILLLALTALTVVALSMIVGIVLVIALLTLPAAGRAFCRVFIPDDGLGHGLVHVLLPGRFDAELRAGPACRSHHYCCCRRLLFRGSRGSVPASISAPEQTGQPYLTFSSFLARLSGDFLFFYHLKINRTSCITMGRLETGYRY